VSEPETTGRRAAEALPTLEILWQQDVSATVFVRAADGSLSADDLPVGIPAVSDLGPLGHGSSARRLSLRELITLAGDPPNGLELGGSARVTFAILDLAARSVAEGLVHPQLERGGRNWLAFWGATLDESVQDALDAVVAALPSVCARAFDGDRSAHVHDLYACAVDQIARDRLRSVDVRLGARSGRSRPSAVELFLAGLSAAEPELPPHSGYGALERRVNEWVDHGLGRRSVAPWLVSLRLDERELDEERPSAVGLELWLQAADDPTLTLPVSLLYDGGEAVFGFLRASDPRIALNRQLGEIEELLAGGGIAFDETEPWAVELDVAAVRFFLREAMPQLEERGIPILLPRDWVTSSSRIRVNLSASGNRSVARSSGLFSTDALASFDWQLAIGDTVLTEQELSELAAAKEPLIRVRGRWHALRHSVVVRGVRFVVRRRLGCVVDIVRAV
jgi:hypothetical protein